MFKTLKFIVFSAILVSTAFLITSCGSDNPITQLFSNEVSAKQRLDSANAQVTRQYGPNTKLVMIFGKNVKSDGKTDISALTIAIDPSQVGAWLYIYRVPGDIANLRVYTPNPTPGASDCIELTSFFSINTVISLIADTSARSIVSGALTLLTNSNVNITTPTAGLMDSYGSLNLANTTNPVIKFNSNFTPSVSTQNGSTFFASGTSQSINMFLIPAAGTLNLPNYITQLTGFPQDLWIVNYKKTDASNNQVSMTLGTIVQTGQLMVIPSLVSSAVINLSETAQ